MTQINKEETVDTNTNPTISESESRSNGANEKEDVKEEEVKKEEVKEENGNDEVVDTNDDTTATEKGDAVAGDTVAGDTVAGDTVVGDNVEEENDDDDDAQNADDNTDDDNVNEESDDARKESPSEDYPPGSIVLAKVKGFPAWPGMVVPENVLPSSVLSAKPRKNRQMWPVRFFVDTTHTWAYRNDLKSLTVDDAAHFLKSASKGRKDKTLYAAYKVASEPPSLDDFIEEMYGGEGEDEDVEEEPQPKKRKTSVGTKASKPAAKSSNKTGTKNSKTAKSTASSSSATKSSASPAETKSKTKETAASSSPTTKPKSSLPPKRTDKEAKVLVIRHKLQRGLLSGTVPEDSELPALSQYLTRLEEFEGLETSIIRTTKINKVLKGIVKLESVPKDQEYGFKDRSLKLLSAWTKLEG